MSRTWKHKEFEILRRVYPDHGAKATLEAFKKAGFTDRTITSIYGNANRLGIKTSHRHTFKKGHRANKKTEFKKGHAPWNKGRRVIMPPNAGQFKKGQAPVNHTPVGTIRWRHNYKRGPEKSILYIKVAEPNKWEQLHRWVWEQFNGPVPKNRILIFKDGDHSNVSVNNMELITRKEHMIRNQDREKIEKHSKLLSDTFIAGVISRGTGKPGSYFLDFPELIEAKRQELILNRELKKLDNAKKKTG